ncbi:MAG: hypothetical protein ACTHU0_32920 [Kofleriaceae bacterium]
MRNLLIVAVLATACSKGGGFDWTSRSVKTVTASVETKAAAGGTEQTSFSIDLPEGMEQKDVGYGLAFNFHVEGRTVYPEFVVSRQKRIDKLDDYVKNHANVTTWLRKDELPNGFVASYENPSYKGKEDYLTEVQLAFGDKVLVCTARLVPASRGAKVKDQVPAVEKVCLSLKPAS